MLFQTLKTLPFFYWRLVYCHKEDDRAKIKFKSRKASGLIIDKALEILGWSTFAILNRTEYFVIAKKLILCYNFSRFISFILKKKTDCPLILQWLHQKLEVWYLCRIFRIFNVVKEISWGNFISALLHHTFSKLRRGKFASVMPRRH